MILELPFFNKAENIPHWRRFKKDFLRHTICMPIIPRSRPFLIKKGEKWWHILSHIWASSGDRESCFFVFFFNENWESGHYSHSWETVAPNPPAETYDSILLAASQEVDVAFQLWPEPISSLSFLG